MIVSETLNYTSMSLSASI